MMLTVELCALLEERMCCIFVHAAFVRIKLMMMIMMMMITLYWRM